jgi:3-hydroxyacyl-CoA dehydrogenase
MSSRSWAGCEAFLAFLAFLLGSYQMRILVVGAGQLGARVLEQLKKNPRLTVLTLDPRENPYALEQGIIAAVDFCESLTPLNLKYILERAQPDLILLARATEDLGLGNVSGMDVLAESLGQELAAICEIPMIKVARI